MAVVKRSKPSNVDRISSLPDHILSQILSLLSTKEAVATSLLSTNWKFLWTSITNLDFDNEEIGHGNKKKVHNMKVVKFTQFVNRVLLLLNPPFIKNFRLKVTRNISDHFYLSSWICAAFARNVQELDLDLTLVKPMKLPLTHFHYNTLVVLTLRGNVHFKIHASASVYFPCLQSLHLDGSTFEIAGDSASACFPCLQSLHLDGSTFAISGDSSVSFPNLKKIKLWFVNHVNEDSVRQLFSSCPVLHELIIYGGHWDNISCLIICIPSLRRLILDLFFYEFELQIDTPALEYLKLNDRSRRKNLTAGRFSSLLEAKVEFGNIETAGFDEAELYSIKVCKFIEQLSRVKSLSLLGRSLEAIRTAPINIFPAFHNLKRVEFQQHKCQDWQAVIQTLLQSMDNLEHLIMKGGMCCASHESWWVEPLNVPKCLQFRITEIHFSNMKDCWDVLELSRYFLKNAKALQLLEIDSNSSPTKFKMFQKISMFPKGSGACQVAFK